MNKFLAKAAGTYRIRRFHPHPVPVRGNRLIKTNEHLWLDLPPNPAHRLGLATVFGLLGGLLTCPTEKAFMLFRMKHLSPRVYPAWFA